MPRSDLLTYNGTNILTLETLGIRRLSIYSAGLPNFNVPGMKHNENDVFLHCNLKNDQ